MALPTQVSPPQVAVSDVAPSAVVGADVVAIPVLAGPDGLTLGPGAAELLDELGDDLFGVLESCEATGEAGEVVQRVVLDTTGLTNTDLRLVLLVGVGEGTPTELRRAGAALARHTKDRLSVATSLAALTDDTGLRAVVEGLVLGSFEFHWRSGGRRPSRSARSCSPGWSTRRPARSPWSGHSRWRVPAGSPARWRWCRRT